MVKVMALLVLGSSCESKLPSYPRKKNDDGLKIGAGGRNINNTEAQRLIFMTVSDHYLLSLPGGICDSLAREL